MQQRICPVDVICYCDVSGKMQPLRVRIRDDADMFQHVNVERVVRSQELTYVGAEAQLFLCRGTVDGRPCFFELRYYLRSHCWCLTYRVY